MRQGYGPWTAADVKRLAELYRAGHGGAEIARTLGRSLASVRARGKRLGLGAGGQRRWTEAETATLKAMWQAGTAPGAIGAALGRSAASVSARAARIGEQGGR